jgi:acetyltransferase-like isoleucine patch superfamily enzyme
MNAVVLPNVILGDYTIVAAGAVVTKSYEHGYCVIGGNPARVIKHLVKEDCVRYENQYKYYGFIPAEKFESYRKKKLMV